MPLDVLGRTRATMVQSVSFMSEPDRVRKPLQLYHVWVRALQLLLSNEEFLVSTCQQPVLTTSLPFVHTARRSYRWDLGMKRLEGGEAWALSGRLPQRTLNLLI